jgi:hypothetical protein
LVRKPGDLGALNDTTAMKFWRGFVLTVPRVPVGRLCEGVGDESDEMARRNARESLPEMWEGQSLPDHARWPGRYLLAEWIIRNLARYPRGRKRQRPAPSRRSAANAAQANIHQRRCSN